MTRPPGRCELDCVAHQVPDHLLQARRIAVNIAPNRTRSRCGAPRSWRRPSRPAHRIRRARWRPDIDAREGEVHPARDDERQVEHVLRRSGPVSWRSVPRRRVRGSRIASSPARSRSSWTQPSIAFSGVRSSCESVARKSSLMRQARWASSASRAASRSSSAIRSSAAASRRFDSRRAAAMLTRATRVWDRRGHSDHQCASSGTATRQPSNQLQLPTPTANARTVPLVSAAVGVGSWLSGQWVGS